ncbi:MAG TPA: hypothetical protein VGG45_20365 [Terracidiphilus sp.]|jgi:hypothetical protein
MKLPAVCLYIVAITVCVLAPGTGNSAPLTRQQLLDMKSAGVAEKVIIDAVVANGIAFPADANAIIALHKAAFSSALLDALTKAQSATSAPAMASNTPRASAGSITQTNSAQPLAQAPANPCAAYEKELERLQNEEEAMSKACEAFANHRKDDASYEYHCIAENNDAIRSRIINYFKTNPNNCPEQYTDTFITPTGWTNDQYSPPPNVTYRAVQTLEPNDSKYSCAELKVVAWELVDNVKQMDKSIQRLSGRAQG